MTTNADRRRNRGRCWRKARRRTLCSYIEPTGRPCMSRAVYGSDACLLHLHGPVT